MAVNRVKPRLQRGYVLVLYTAGLVCAFVDSVGTRRVKLLKMVYCLFEGFFGLKWMAFASRIFLNLTCFMCRAIGILNKTTKLGPIDQKIFSPFFFKFDIQISIKLIKISFRLKH